MDVEYVLTRLRNWTVYKNHFLNQERGVWLYMSYMYTVVIDSNNLENSEGISFPSLLFSLLFLLFSFYFVFSLLALISLSFLLSFSNQYYRLHK